MKRICTESLGSVPGSCDVSHCLWNFI